jgi:hypothetical protein
MKAYNARPDIKAKMKAYQQTPGYKAKKKAYNARPDIKAKKKAYQQTYYRNQKQQRLATIKNTRLFKKLSRVR